MKRYLILPLVVVLILAAAAVDPTSAALHHQVVAAMAVAAGAAAVEPPLTIDAFCKIEGMSRATYYKLRRLGLGPELTEIVVSAEEGVNHGKGVNFIRISAAAHRAWHEKITKIRASEASKLEAARAHEQRVEAGKRAAKSVKHVSRRARPKPRRRPRRGAAKTQTIGGTP
jgi:hypothetical protein